MLRAVLPLGVRLTSAIVRPPADSFAAGLTTAGGGAPDLARARRQHANYCAALEGLGVAVTALPPDAAFPDSTFVEDVAVVTQHGAMLTRPGAPSRAGEVSGVRPVLASHCGSVAEIAAPGTLDGGDVCQAGSHFFIGISRRTNDEGARQLAVWLNRSGFTASTIDICENSELLHLKSGLAWLGGTTLVLTQALAGHPALRGYQQIVVSPAESYAANCVRVNDSVLMAAGFPVIAQRVVALGFQVVPLDVSEFAKMDGGLSCLSLRLPILVPCACTSPASSPQSWLPALGAVPPSAPAI
jgi:dimethylargininase